VISAPEHGLWRAAEPSLMHAELANRAAGTICVSKPETL
jgi:hypothetical protein